MMNSLPTIPREEYPARLERLRILMSEEGINAVLLGTGRNLAYFSGYPSPAKSVPRPFFLILPMRGEPILFTHLGHLEEVRRFCVYKDIREYTKLSRIPAEEILNGLVERGLLGKRIGMELGYEQSLDVSYLEFRRFQEALGSTELTDASDILWRLRMVKSSTEIACLRAACKITSDAYSSVFSSLHRGISERDIVSHMLTYFDQHDTGDERFIAITSGKGNYDLVTKPPESTPISRGDMIWMDAGCTVSGYWSDFSRAAMMGEPAFEQVQGQEAIHSLTWDAVARVRPGVTVSSIARFCKEQLAQLKLPVTSWISNRASRCGHGLGLSMTEPPHIAEYDQTVLQPGMAITIEPGVATPYGTFHVEENVVVTDDGCEVLSESPRTLWRIEA